MALPDGLLITGAVVGRAGGLIGVATGIDNLVARVKRTAQAKRDATMVLDVEFRPIGRFEGADGAKYPVADAIVRNNGKQIAKDVKVTSSLGFCYLDRQTVENDSAANLSFSVTDVRLVGEGASKQWRPTETPYRVSEVTLSITWRVDGSSDRSQPLTFTADYTEPPLG